MLYTIPFWFTASSYDLVNGNFYAGKDASTPIKQHYTIMFNTFVLMNLVNMVACRKLAWDDTQIFRHFLNNKLFLFVLAAELGV
jgi:Cation transporting ATPase, C-terminus